MNTDEQLEAGNSAEVATSAQDGEETATVKAGESPSADAGDRSATDERDESADVDAAADRDADDRGDAKDGSDAEEESEDDDKSEGDGTSEDTTHDEGDDTDDEEGDQHSPGKRQAALENEGEIAADYLEELLDIADLDGDIDTFIEAGRARVSVITDSDVLVGRDGEVLEALQELARLAVMTETGKRSRLMLDIAGHRDRRRHELEAIAQDAVVEVKESGEPVRLQPMNPFERKIVHDVVAAAGLVSESEGQEPSRRVVVMPA